jgi:hypothetical protein
MKFHTRGQNKNPDHWLQALEGGTLAKGSRGNNFAELAAKSDLKMGCDNVKLFLREP